LALVGNFAPIVIFVAIVLVGFVVDLFLLGTLKRITKRTPIAFDDLLLNSFGKVFMFIVVLVALYFSVNATYLASKFSPNILKIFNSAILAGIIMAIGWVVADLINHGIDAYVKRLPQEVPTGIIKSIVKLIILTVSLLVALESSGISVTPILTALGVGGLAVALALQDSLSNLFAGINVVFSGQVRRGDFVKLENGEEGFVEDMTWRNTLIRTMANNIVIVPNSKLASSILVNYDLIDKPRGVPVALGVAYSSDLDRVERITLEVAREVQREITEKAGRMALDNLQRKLAEVKREADRARLQSEMEALERLIDEVREWNPILRYREFGDSSINFIVILRAITVDAVFLLKHEFIKRVKRRYDEEGIEIPFPQRDIWFRNWPQS